MSNLHTPGGLERRAVVAEIRASDDSDHPKIVGHAAVFNQLSEDLGGFREQIAPGAFSDAIKSDDVRALFNHSPDFVLGRTRAGTLKLAEDKTGLHVEIDPPDTQQARDVLALIRRGDVSQMSFGFIVQKQEWDMSDKANITRTLTQVRLFDVSPVTFPAYPQTDVAVRALQAMQAHNHEVLRHAIDLRRRRLALSMA